MKVGRILPAAMDPRIVVHVCSAPMRLVRRVLCLALISGQVLVSGCSRLRRESGEPCDFARGGLCTLKVDGTEREYALHIPQSFRPGQGGLVIVLHGSRGSGPRMEKMSGFDAVADRKGFVVAYPSALDNNTGHSVWNVYFNASTFAQAPDDTGFLRQLIGDLQAKLRVDPKRVYVAGFSNGGYMAHRAGVELSDLVAAVAIVDGSLYVLPAGNNSSVPQPRFPLSVVLVHGTDDQPVKYCGAVTNGNVTASQDQSFNFWSKANGCSNVLPPKPLCVAGQVNDSVAKKRATTCRLGTEVEIYRIVHGQHVWYDRLNNLPGADPYNADLGEPLSTAELLWRFFESHPRPTR